MKMQQKILRLPKPLRQIIGFLLLCGGLLGFLPILGFWMIVPGLAVLAMDFKWAKKMSVKLEQRILNRKKNTS